MAYRVGNGETASFAASGRVDTDLAYRGAARHSRHVRLLRIAIPVAVFVGGAILLLATWLNPLRILYDLPIGLGNLVVSGTKITMESPRLAGYTRDSRAYEVSARAAAQDVTKPDLVELREIRAKLDMQDKSVMEMTAVSGIYNSKSEMLTLGENILISSSTGFRGRLSEAVVDIRKGSIVSKKPVEMSMLQGTLNSNALEVTGAGELLRFSGGVAMVLTLGKAGDGAAAKADEQ
jgi:lipopolysaccharide export system protein LptC